MLPHEVQEDAVDYVKQWRDEERDRWAGLPRTVVVWPGGPYDFVLVEARENVVDRPTPSPGWTYVTGRVVEPEDPPWGWHTFYCRPTDFGYEMIPKRPV